MYWSLFFGSFDIKSVILQTFVEQLTIVITPYIYVQKSGLK